MWNGGDCGAPEMNHHQPPRDQSSAKEGDAMFMVGLEGSSVLYELLPENQVIHSNKYCSQLDQLKAALGKMSPELVDRKHIIFQQDNARLPVSLMAI